MPLLRYISRTATAIALAATSIGCVAQEPDQCLEVSLTGTLGGPAFFKDLAGAGTLVKFGTVENGCSDVHMQFDIGRATGMRLSQLGVQVNQLDAAFITHLHSDHTVGLVDLMQTRWHFFGSPMDLVCSDDIEVGGEHAREMSCASFAENITSAAEQAGEIGQRSSESTRRKPEGPATILNHIPVTSPLPTEPRVVWESGEVTVSAIASTHIPGHLSYRVDSPAGSVVIGGDAGNEKSAPPRDSSTSSSVELLAQNADVLVHSTIHPVFGPDSGSTFPAPIFYRQSTSTDLGSLAKRAEVKHLMLTHLIPVLNSDSHGIYPIPGGALTEADFEASARETGYEGNVHVGKDLLTLRLLASEQ